MRSFFFLTQNPCIKVFFYLLCVLDTPLFSATETGLQLRKTFEKLCARSKLNAEEKTFFLAKKAAELNCPFERIPTHNSTLFQYFYEENWNVLDLWHNACYVQLDNHSLASFDEIADDPFLVLRTKIGGPTAFFSLSDSWDKLAHFKILDHHEWPSISADWESKSFAIEEDLEGSLGASLVEVIEFEKEFVLSENACEAIWWQITSDKNFDFLIPNLNQIQSATDRVALNSLCQSFLNPAQDYFIRIKGLQDGVWSEWSTPFRFQVFKPMQVKEITFIEQGQESYELSWQADEDPSTRYWIFGSNALDFFPPIYAQVKPSSDYTFFISTQNRVQIDPKYAFYRIIAEKDGIYSVPSELIRIYGKQMHHPASVLQLDTSSKTAIRKALFSPPNASPSTPNTFSSLKPAHISEDIWQAVSPYLLPDNHPLKGTLDRIFSKARALADAKSLKKAGFYWTKKGSYSAIYPTKHKKIRGYFIKLLTDEQENEDWKNWLSRIQGAQATQAAIDELGYQSLLKVPRKFIYALPSYPSPTSSCTKRKNFILLSEDMGIVARQNNKAMFREKMTKAHLTAIYTVVTKVGLKDSLYYNNIPWTKDGRLAFVDTEHHHVWPVLYKRFFKLLSPEMLAHWKALIRHNGPTFEEIKK